MEQKELEKYIKSGLSIRAISKESKLSVPTVVRYLKKYQLKTTLKISHPNLKIEYFKKIDSLEKAYWLGFLYADACMRKIGNSLALKLELAQKDEDQIDKFCNAIGAELSKKTYYTRLNKYNSVCIGIYNLEFNEYLIKNGCIPQKTFRIKHPNFESERLDLAFLLGFYDGDGSVGGVICCGNKSFLTEIAEKHNIQKHLRVENKVPFLRIPKRILKKMFENYQNSMKRKRKFTNIPNYEEKNGFKYKAKTKIIWPTNEVLQKLVWEKPTQKLAVSLGVSDKAIEKHCIKNNISKPPRGHWNKLKLVGNTGVDSA